MLRHSARKEKLQTERIKSPFPSDLHVKVRDIALKPVFALTSWAGFTKAGDSAVTYGDLTVLESEMNPVISKLMEKGIEVAALTTTLSTRIPGSSISISLATVMK